MSAPPTNARVLAEAHLPASGRKKAKASSNTDTEHTMVASICIAVKARSAKIVGERHRKTSGASVQSPRGGVAGKATVAENSRRAGSARRRWSLHLEHGAASGVHRAVYAESGPAWLDVRGVELSYGFQTPFSRQWCHFLHMQAFQAERMDVRLATRNRNRTKIPEVHMVLQRAVESTGVQRWRRNGREEKKAPRTV